MAPIIPTEEYFMRLNSLLEPAEVLQKNGFIVRQLTDEELMLKRRCSGSLTQLLRKHATPLKVLPKLEVGDSSLAAAAQRQLSIQETLDLNNVQDATLTVADKQKPTLRCRYHEGCLVAKRWTCCGRDTTAEPCGGSYEHIPRAQELGELFKQYQCYETPVILPKSHDVRVAVALDCEMGTAASGDPELIRLTMIDYFSEEILVDNLVEPDVPMRHLNTRFSGVSWADFKNARKTGTCLSGKAGARLAIWKYVGTDTIVIGHGVSNDLRALRWIHTSVVDSLLLESGRLKSKIMEEGKNELPKQENLQNLAACSVGLEECAEKRVHVRRPGGNSLKTLAKKYLNRDIQLNGKRGHDSLEDAIAARDLVHRSTVCFDGDM